LYIDFISITQLPQLQCTMLSRNLPQHLS